MTAPNVGVVIGHFDQVLFIQDFQGLNKSFFVALAVKT